MIKMILSKTKDLFCKLPREISVDLSHHIKYCARFSHDSIDHSCGIACITMALSYYKKTCPPLSTLIEEAENQRLFHPVYGLILKRSNRILKRYHLKAKVHPKLSIKRLCGTIVHKKPVIASIRTPDRPRHLVLVCGVNIKNHEPHSFIFFDPSSPSNHKKNKPKIVSAKIWKEIYNFRGLEVLGENNLNESITRLKRAASKIDSSKLLSAKDQLKDL